MKPVEVVDLDSESELVGEFSHLPKTDTRTRPRFGSDSLAATAVNVLPKPPAERNLSSTLDDVDIYRIRREFNLPIDTHLRPDSAGPDEIVVYEAFFASGLQDMISSLVGEVAAYLRVSPGQFSPLMWTT